MSEQRTKDRAEASSAAAAPAAGSANAWITAAQAIDDGWYQLDHRIHNCIETWISKTIGGPRNTTLSSMRLL